MAENPSTPRTSAAIPIPIDLTPEQSAEAAYTALVAVSTLYGQIEASRGIAPEVAVRMGFNATLALLPDGHPFRRMLEIHREAAAVNLRQPESTRTSNGR